MDKVFASFQTQIENRNPFYRHNVVGYNTFYDSTVRSGLSVSFNQRPSENKILKSISIEGTSNSTPLGVLVANNSTVAGQAKQSDVIAFDDHGGIMYGVIQGLNRNSTANINLVGRIVVNESFSVEGNAVNGTFIYHDGGQGYVLDGGKYVLGVNLESGPEIVSNTIDPVDLSGTFQDVPDLIVFGGDNTLTINSLSIGLSAQLPDQTNIYVYAVTPTVVNGDMLRGQYADAVFSFGSTDWEVFAVNLEYEPTTYDHSKAASMPSRRRGSRRRRR